MDFDGFFTEPFQGFDDKPSEIEDSLTVNTEFSLTPSAFSELPCDLSGISQLPLSDFVKQVVSAEAITPDVFETAPAVDTSNLALKLSKKARFQPYDNAPAVKKEPIAKKVDRSADEYKHTEEYRLRREKNNEAVRKSRAKAKQKSKETEETVTQLRQENTDLKRSLEDLQNQLDTLKTLLTSQAE